MEKVIDLSTNQATGRVRPMITVQNNEVGYSYEWPVDKFEQRYFLIVQYHDDFMDDGIMQNFTNEKDPFWDPMPAAMLGLAKISLMPLSRYQDTLYNGALTNQASNLTIGQVMGSAHFCDINGNRV